MRDIVDRHQSGVLRPNKHNNTTMSESVSVDVDGVSKVFGNDRNAVTALDDVSITIQDGEFFTLLGPSGCGKTTLLRLIAGFEHPSTGVIRLYGDEISHLPPYLRPVNTVFQSYALFPHMTVAENIGFGLEMQNQPRSQIRETVDQMLALVQMEALADRRTDQISGGQQQRVALARALAPKPRVLLLDEPLSALDYKLRKGMQIELKRLQHETGITFIFVTHDQEEALTMSDRIAVLNQGQVLQIGRPREIYTQPKVRFVADFIGDTNFLDAVLLECDRDRSLLKLASGRTLHARGTGNSVDGNVHITVRPEQAHLVGMDQDWHLEGEIATIVYSGTDTHYHLKLDDGPLFIVRMQNSQRWDDDWREGQRAGIRIDPDSVQILAD